MELGKKGILFTFLSIIIAALLSIMYSTSSTTPLDAEVNLEAVRVLSTNQYLRNLVDYTEHSMRLSGYKAFQEITDYIYQNGFLNDEQEINDFFVELVINGSINSIPKSGMENVTLDLLLEKVVNVSNEELDINTTINITQVWVDQVLPFTVFAYMNFSIQIQRGNIKWNYSNSTISRISIEGLKDPLYFNIGYNQTFKPTKILLMDFNISTFEEFVNKSQYIVIPTATFNFNDTGTFRPYSFFGRLVNDSSVKDGPLRTITSVVSPERLEYEADIPLDNQPINMSYMDFIYGKEFAFEDCDSSLWKVVNTTNRPIVDYFNLWITFNISQSAQLEDVVC